MMSDTSNIPQKDIHDYAGLCINSKWEAGSSLGDLGHGRRQAEPGLSEGQASGAVCGQFWIRIAVGFAFQEFLSPNLDDELN